MSKVCFSEKTKDHFYENYFDKEQYESYKYDVGAFCTRKAIISKIKHRSGNVLEIGTGMSSLLLDLPRFNCYGIDISSTTIEGCKTLFDRLGKKADLRVADAQEIPFESNFFDLIVSAHTLEHVKADEKVIKECLRLLKPGGQAIFFVPGRINGTATEQEWLTLGHYRSYNARLFKALEAAVPGLRLVEITYPHKIHNFVWNRLKTLVRWSNYPIKKWLLRDNKPYESRPTYQKMVLPAVATALDFFDRFTHTKEKNFFGSEFNVLACFEKVY
jgi:SAM-dependent methyltransferase